MRKTAIIFFVLMSVLWQAIAMAGQALVADHAQGVAHAVLHLENEAHHHDADGTFQVDTSDEARRHVALDGSAPTAGILPAAVAVALPSFADARHPSGVEPALSSPFLEGPRRPPRLTA